MSACVRPVLLSKQGLIAGVDRAPSLLERCEGDKGESPSAFAASRVSGETNADSLCAPGASGACSGSNHGIPICKYGLAGVDGAPPLLEGCEGDKGNGPSAFMASRVPGDTNADSAYLSWSEWGVQR